MPAANVVKFVVRQRTRHSDISRHNHEKGPRLCAVESYDAKLILPTSTSTDARSHEMRISQLELLLVTPLLAALPAQRRALRRRRVSRIW